MHWIDVRLMPCCFRSKNFTRLKNFSIYIAEKIIVISLFYFLSLGQYNLYVQLRTNHAKSMETINIQAHYRWTTIHPRSDWLRLFSRKQHRIHSKQIVLSHFRGIAKSKRSTPWHHCRCGIRKLLPRQSIRQLLLLRWRAKCELVYQLRPSSPCSCLSP